MEKYYKKCDLFFMFNLLSMVAKHIKHKMVGDSKHLQILIPTFFYCW